MSYTKNETLSRELHALKDIISFCEGRMKLDINKDMKLAYRDVRFLAKQHFNLIIGIKK